MYKLLVASFFTISAFTSASLVSASSPNLIQDSAFANGFGACFWLGQNFDPGPEWLKRGLCQSYLQTPGHTVRVIPDNNDSQSVAQNNQNKYWEINDGIHERDRFGVDIADPFIHRFNVNNRIIDNQPAILNIEQLNQNGQRVKQISTNKHGKIYLYYNSKNEPRNVANKYSSEFAYDTWPTFQLNQNFREYIDLAQYNRLNISLSPKIISWTILPGWPYTATSGSANPEMDLNLYTFIRKRDQLNQGMFVGIALYSSDPTRYSPYSNLDQHGQGFFRDDVRQYGGPALPAQYTTIQFDLLKLIDKALLHSQAKKPDGTPYTHADYVLSSFDLGFEGMGWFEGSFDVQNLSMIGEVIGSTSQSLAGDLNSDGHVNSADYTLFLAGFPSKYTILDYAKLIAGYNK